MLKEREQKVLQAGIEIGREEGIGIGREIEREESAKKDRAEIMAFYQNGASIELIASSKNLSIEAVKQILKEEGIPC